ncbi:Urb2/Npa2 family-domain-containing protein [Trametes elegans]|nr:Urb2/Npa2 family-domain-containing protein [Trametes elegans]
MLGPQNAQDFIRALKASSDPPHVGGPFKIDIARDAWDNTLLYVPNKAEAIVEWLLTRLLKDKSKDRQSNPICDSRYWGLLRKVLVASGAEEHSDHNRALRAWLVPLLNRVPFAPVILSYLEYAAKEGSLDVAQYALVSQCIAILWPLAVPKFNPETLLECFGAAVQLVVVQGGPSLSDGGLQALDGHRALSLIVSSYRAALSNAGSKRKQLHTLFLQKHLHSWLQVAMRSGEGERGHPQLASDIYDAGIDTVYGLEVLKPAVDQKHDPALADALERTRKDDPSSVLRPLPRLFSSYVHAMRRHKGALFGQGSSQAPGQVADQVQSAAMAFYGVCDALARAGEGDAYWRCRVALLEVVERENLFNPKDDDVKALLRQDGDLAVEALANAWVAQQTSRTDNAVKVLAGLTRVDYDLMAASSAVIFPRLIAIPSTVTSASQYLQLLLEYESKTRNLPSLIAHICQAFSVPHLQRVPGGPKAAYGAASAGPLICLPFLDDLSRAVRGFLTPGQVLETIRDVSRILQDAYGLFLEREARLSADRGDGPRKKRKKEAPVSEDRTEPEYYAVSFALVARSMTVVLNSLPLHTLTEDGRLEAEKAISEVYSAVAARALGDGFLQSERREYWHWQTVVTGALCLHYGLASVTGLQQQVRLGQPILSAMISTVSKPGASSELVVEMFRTLLHQCSLDTLQPSDVLDKLLKLLESHLPSHKTIWSGKAHALSSEGEAAVALLHLLVDRWLPYFDAWSNPEHRKKFAQILTNAQVDECTHPASVLSATSVISRMLHDAEFWELLNIRDAFLAQINEQTSQLDEGDLSALLSQLKKKKSPCDTEDVLRFASAYDTLLLAPLEYLPRTLHVELLRRGLLADVLAFSTSQLSTKSTVSSRNLLVIREFLRRSIAYLGSIESVVSKEYLDYLVERTSTVAADEDLGTVTMELIDMYQGALVRAAKRGSASTVTDLLNRYIQTYADGVENIGHRAALLLVVSLVREGSATDFPEDVVEALRRLYKQMLAVGTKNYQLSSEAPLVLDVLETWSHVQTLRQWLKDEDSILPVFGEDLSRRLLTWSDDKEQLASLAPVVLAILLAEVQDAAPSERGGRLLYVIVAYLSLARSVQGGIALESRMGSTIRTFSPDDFSVILELVYDGLPLQRGLSSREIASLIRFSNAVLCNAPEGTSKICQSFTTRCLNLFANDERFTLDFDLRREVVDFLVRQSSDRVRFIDIDHRGHASDVVVCQPASLRTADLSSLWSLLRALLAGSPVHEQSTDVTVFHGVVNVLSALVRLRRDLVLNTLPHLGQVLRQLASCLRSLRPQLGGKQRRLVVDTLPRWLAPAQPLAGAESKALARLLTTLTTKTMVRVHGPAADAQKPEALARPFSKHAAGVLAAYVDAVNDPLCFVSAQVRRELQPGLFALCDMLGEHNRDAMMVSALDAGGKATMKALWREYEKQRYVGKG